MLTLLHITTWRQKSKSSIISLDEVFYKELYYNIFFNPHLQIGITLLGYIHK